MKSLLGAVGVEPRGRVICGVFVRSTGSVFREELRGHVDNITVDWNQQAARKAKEYLATGGFSRSGLLDQLAYEGFTAAQAQYGVNSVGY